MLKFYAVPDKRSLLEDFDLSESLCQGLVSEVIKTIFENKVSDDESAIAEVINEKMIFFVHQGSNKYTDLINFIGNDSNIIYPKYVENVPKDKIANRVAVIVPEKQTVYSKRGLYSPKFSDCYDSAVDNLNKSNDVNTLMFSEFFSEKDLHKNLTFTYDSHLTNYGSILIFIALCKRLGLVIDLCNLDWDLRTFKPDLLNKYLDVELQIPWVRESALVEEILPKPGRNRGLIRRYKAEGENIIPSKCLIVGDSHSYSGLAAIAGNYFSEVIFAWDNPFTIDAGLFSELSDQVNYTIYEISERFFYSTIVSSNAK